MPRSNHAHEPQVSPLHSSAPKMSEAIVTIEDEDYCFAHQHGHLAACTIFRPLGKTGQRKQRVVHHRGGERTPNPYRLKIVSTWELDTDDESVLLVLISMIASHRRIQQIAPGHSCRKALQESGAWIQEMTGATFTNRHEIFQKLGWKRTGKNYTRINKSIERLNHTLITYIPDDGYEMQSKLISICRYQEKGVEVDNRLLVTLNPLSAAVIFGTCKSGISIHEIHERRLLGQSQLALGIYSQFVFLTRPGNKTSRNIYLSTLLQRVYGLDEKTRPSPKQRELVSSCVRKWDLPGWKVSLSGRGDAAMVRILRPKPGNRLADDDSNLLPYSPLSQLA